MVCPCKLSRAAAFWTTLQANADDLPLLGAKLEELNSRCEAVGRDFATIGALAQLFHSSCSRGLHPRTRRSPRKLSCRRDLREILGKHEAFGS